MVRGAERSNGSYLLADLRIDVSRCWDVWSNNEVLESFWGEVCKRTR